MNLEQRVCGPAALALVLIGAGVAVFARDEPPAAIRLTTVGTPGGTPAFQVTGLDRASLSRIAQEATGDRVWAELFAVYVQPPGAANADGVPPIVGTYRIEGGILQFDPRFPLVAGVSYRAVLRIARLGGAAAGSPAIVAQFTIPKPARSPTRVEQIYPTSDELPANLLKFYLHFSAPMRQGGSYEFVHLIDESGREVEMPFLQLEEELWDSSGQRLTLLIDPGRIKREVGPREGFGPVLRAGKRYTLVIDRTWCDAAGNPLTAAARKSFRAVEENSRPPTLASWAIVAPAAHTREPLAVVFPGPLDHALLGHMIRVHAADGPFVRGRVLIDRHEARWRLEPDQPWPSGRFELVVDTSLEDLAGNNLRHPFERDVFGPITKTVEAKTLRREFEIKALASPTR